MWLEFHVTNFKTRFDDREFDFFSRGSISMGIICGYEYVKWINQEI